MVWLEKSQLCTQHKIAHHFETTSNEIYFIVRYEGCRHSTSPAPAFSTIVSAADRGWHEPKALYAERGQQTPTLASRISCAAPDCSIVTAYETDRVFMRRRIISCGTLLNAGMAAAQAPVRQPEPPMPAEAAGRSQLQTHIAIESNTDDIRHNLRCNDEC